MDIKHTYSYTAVFEDGHIIERDMNDPEGDKSLTTEAGSRFTDVQNYEKTSKLISFVIHNNQISWGVDLRDGHFEVGGIPFWQHRPDLEPYKDFRVIHYRTVRRTLNQETGEQTGETLAYAVGWQVTHKGENVQRIVVVNP